MIEFKKNIQGLLPYSRQQYIGFLDEETDSTIKWSGVSFQLPGGYEGRKISPAEYLEAYKIWLKDIISQLDNGSSWIVNHDDKDLQWLPNDEDNLFSLRTVFKENNIPNTFRGALILKKDDLLKLSRDLLCYPTDIFNTDGLFYKNLDISHEELPFIIKITGHWNVHLLSPNKQLLVDVVNRNISNKFILKSYRGTSL